MSRRLLVNVLLLASTGAAAVLFIRAELRRLDDAIAAAFEDFTDDFYDVDPVAAFRADVARRFDVAAGGQYRATVAALGAQVDAVFAGVDLEGGGLL